MIAFGGDYQKPSLLPVPVSLTRRGLPRIIPSFHRKRIMRGGSEAESIVQMYLSFFSLYRIVLQAKKIKKDTFASILQPCADIDRARSRISFFKQDIVVLFDRYVPWFRRIPLNQGITWEPTWKTVPTMRQFRDYLKAGLYSENSKTKVPDVKSFFPCLTFELSAYTFLIHFIQKMGELWSSGILRCHRVRYPCDKSNKRMGLRFFFLIPRSQAT